MSDQTFKRDADKIDPLSTTQLPNLSGRVAHVSLKPQEVGRGRSQWVEWYSTALIHLPLVNRTIGMYQAFDHGAQKYDTFSWRVVEQGLYRYTGSAIRHFLPELYYPQDRETGFIDSESGLHHFSHAAASLAICLDLLEQP